MTNAHSLTDIILLEVLERMKLSDISQSRYDEYKAKLGPVIEDRIIGTLLESLTPNERSAFEELSNSGAFSKDAINILFGNPDKLALIEKELTALVEELSMPL